MKGNLKKKNLKHKKTQNFTKILLSNTMHW